MAYTLEGRAFTRIALGSHENHFYCASFRPFALVLGVKLGAGSDNCG